MLRPRGEAELSGDQSLAGAGVFSGAILELIGPEAADVPQPAHPEPRIGAMSGGQYMRFLEDAISARQITRSMVVAVMAAQPGAGTTTIAALLATLLGRLRSDSVALADVDRDSGALSHWLAPDAPRPNLGRALDPHRVLAAMVKVGGNTSVLPAPSGEAGWASLIEQLRHLYKIVVLDCAAGFTKPACRAALAAADVVVLVVRPGRVAPTLARARTVVLVENQSPRATRTPVQSTGERVIHVADEPAAAHRLKTRGFSWDMAPPTWQDSIRELAAVLVGSAT